MGSRTQPAAVPSRFSPGLILAAALLLSAFVLRFARLGHTPMWIDELDVFWNSRSERGPLDVILYTLGNCFEINTNEQMPFQYAWLKLFLGLYRLLGITEPGAALIRLPMALLGWLAVGLLYPVARRLYGRATGLWALGLGAVSFFQVYQSRDATAYNPLMFFLALHLLGATGWLRGEPPRLGDRLAFVAGAAGLLLSHLSAWFFLGAEGLLWAGRAAWRRWRGAEKRTWSAEWRGGAFEPAGWLLLCALPFLIVPWRAITAYQPPGLKEEVEISTLSWPFLRYQLAHFGWGLGAGRLAGFALALAGGAAALFSVRSTRARGAAHLFMLAAPVLLLFAVPHSLVFPRYLTIVYFPLLILAARGLAWWTEQAGRALRLPARWAFLPAAAVAALVAAWHVRPMAQLFALRTKLMPVPQLIEWLESRLPENGLYVWESGYNLRDVPGAYPVRGRQAAFMTMHSGTIRAPGVAERLAPMGRDLFQRFPLAALLATGFPEPPAEGPWAWIATDFARREVIRNEGLEALHRYGFSPHGMIYPANLNIVCYFNRPEDLSARQAADGSPFLAYPDGPGWRYLQTREGLLFACPEPAGALRVRNPSGETRAARVRLEGAVQAAGSLRVTGPDGQVLTRTLQPGNQVRQEFGPFSFPPGDHEVRMEFWPSGRNALLVYAFQVIPGDAEP